MEERVFVYIKAAAGLLNGGMDSEHTVFRDTP